MRATLRTTTMTRTNTSANTSTNTTTTTTTTTTVHNMDTTTEIFTAAAHHHDVCTRKYIRHIQRQYSCTCVPCIVECIDAIPASGTWSLLVWQYVLLMCAQCEMYATRPCYLYTQILEYACDEVRTRTHLCTRLKPRGGVIFWRCHNS